MKRTTDQWCINQVLDEYESEPKELTLARMFHEGGYTQTEMCALLDDVDLEYVSSIFKLKIINYYRDIELGVAK